MNAMTPECSITEVSELLGLSLRAIRLYDERGLIRVRRDGRNRRRFDPAARAHLQAIATLRRAGFGLEAIREILEAGQLPGAPALSRAIAEALRRRAAKLEAEARDLRELLGQLYPWAERAGAGDAR